MSADPSTPRPTLGADRDSGHPWRHIPTGTATRRPATGTRGVGRITATAATRVVAAVVIGALGPFVRTLLIAPAPAPVVVAAAGALALIIGARARWPLGPCAAVAAGVAALPFGGFWVAAWLIPGLVLAAWVVLDRPPHPRIPVPGAEALPPVIVLSLLATWWGRKVLTTWPPLAATTAATAIALFCASQPGILGHLSTRITDAVRRATGAALLLPLWVVAVFLPWILHRSLGVDPLAAPLSPAGTIRRQRRDVRPSRLWSEPVAMDRLPRSQRVRRRLVLPAAALIAVAGLAAQRTWGTHTPPIPAAMRGDAWWPQYRDTVRWYEAEGFDPLTFRRAPDLRSPYVNVEDGMRRTWRPPPCQCRRVRLWLYGGSTTFGFGQRDDHTIASELARRAFADGISLDVDNRGVSGDTHWAEAIRFAWDLTAPATPREPRPDLTIFLDGVNELGGSQKLNEAGRGADPVPADLSIEDLRQGLATPQRYFRLIDGLSAPDGVRLVLPTPQPLLDPVQLAAVTAERYERSRQLSGAVASRAKVPVVWFWQPMRLLRPPVPGEIPRSPADELWARRYAEATRSALSPDIVDISRSLNGVDEPLYYDDAHTNERGARLVAAAIYGEIEADLRSALTEGP